MVVVDASVVVKWFVEEVHSEEALAIRDAYVDGRIDLSAPSLLPYEVTNALRYSGEFDGEALASVATAISKYDLDLVPFDRIDDVTKLALDADVTAYDAAYVALGETLEEPVYTADERLLDDVEAVSNRAEHVREFE